MTQSMTSIAIIVLLILDSEILIEKQSFLLLDELIEFDLCWSDKTARQTHWNKILWSSSWYFSASLGRNYDLQDRISKFEIFLSPLPTTSSVIWGISTQHAQQIQSSWHTDEETSWVIQSIVIIVRLLLLDRWFTMIMKLTQFFESRRQSDQILFELNVHMIIIEIKRKSRPTKWMTNSSEHAATDESTRYQVMFRIFLRWVWSLLWNWRGKSSQNIVSFKKRRYLRTSF